jgi:hypothetical protein
MTIPFDLSVLQTLPLTDPDLQYCLQRFGYFPNLVKWLLGPDPEPDAAVLQSLIKETEAAVQPDRPMGWSKQLNRDGSGDGVRPEDRWERTIWRKWRPSKDHMPKTNFHKLAPWVLSYQVPLNSEKKSEGGGKIDLIGVSPEHLPVVVEVKAENSQDSPLAVVLEAVRYGVALRKLWPSLRDEWIKALEEQGLLPKEPLPLDLKHCQLICAAPSEYWDARGPRTPSGPEYRSAWIVFHDLCAKLKTVHGFSVEFVSLEFSAKTLDA